MRPSVYSRARIALVIAVGIASPSALLSCQRDASPDASAAVVSPPAAAAPAPAPPDVSPPTPPTDLVVRASPGRADLSWTGSGDDDGVEGYDVLRGDERVARVPRPQAQDLGIRAGERSCYTVVAFDAAGNRSAPSEPACAVAPDVTAPAAPAGLTARLVSPREAELRWTAATDDVGIERYELLRGEKVVATATGTSARTSGLAPGRRACFEVRAVDAAGNTSERSPAACVAGADVTPPAAPGALSATARGTRVELRWTASKDDVGAVRYEILRDGAPLAAATATSAVDATVRAARKYCYTVRGFDAASNASPPAGPVCATPPDVTPPTVPSGVAIRPQGTNGLALRWTASADDVGVARYDVLRADEIAVRTNRLEATVWPFRAAVEHCLRVRACDAAGNCSAPSTPACATLPDVEPPAQVALVTVTPESDTRLTLHWTSAADDVGVDEYEIRDGDRAMTVAGGETSLADSGLRPGTRHCYTVVARDAARNTSRRSAPACATTPDLTPPTVPSDLVSAPRSSRQVFVSWHRSTDDVGVAGYEVLQGGVVVARTAQLSAWIDDLAPEQEYCHSVRAVDAAGNRSAPAEPICVRTAAAAAPAAPWNVSARAVVKGLELSWEPSPDPNVVYTVFRGGQSADVAIGITSSRTWRVVGTAAAERRCYRVAAVDPERRASPKTLPLCASVKTVGEAPERAAAPNAGSGAP